MNQNNITPNSTMHANQALLYQHVDFLTTLRPFRNHMNVASLDQVCDYLKHEFTTYRLDLHEQPFEANGKKYRNVIASYNSEKNVT